jgi:hypothetical protein
VGAGGGGGEERRGEEELGARTSRTAAGSSRCAPRGSAGTGRRWRAPRRPPCSGSTGRSSPWPPVLGGWRHKVAAARLSGGNGKQRESKRQREVPAANRPTIPATTPAPTARADDTAGQDKTHVGAVVLCDALVEPRVVVRQCAVGLHDLWKGVRTSQSHGLSLRAATPLCQAPPPPARLPRAHQPIRAHRPTRVRGRARGISAKTRCP